MAPQKLRPLLFRETQRPKVPYVRSLGSRASRNASPKMENASDRTKRNTVALVSGHQMLGSRESSSFPLAIICPQVGSLGGIPILTKLRNTSRLTDETNPNVKVIMTRCETFGRICAKIIRPWPTPRARAAKT